jgi:hypothetical protein
MRNASLGYAGNGRPVLLMYNDSLDGDCYHSDDLRDAGRALEAVRFVTVDKQAVYERNITETRRRIAENRREAK